MRNLLTYPPRVCHSLVWAKPKVGALNSISRLVHVRRGPKCLNPDLVSLGSISREMGWKWGEARTGTRDSSTDAGVSRNSVSCCATLPAPVLGISGVRYMFSYEGLISVTACTE